MIEEIENLANRYKQKGFLSPLEIYSYQEIKHFQDSFNKFESNVSLIREDYENLHFHALWAQKMATHHKLLDLIEALIGPEILIYGTLILSKIPGKKSHLSWHQDQYFLKHKKTSPYVTAWIALTPSTIENGCMKMIPCSHLEGIQMHEPFVKDSTNLITRGEEIKHEYSKNEIFDNILKSGQLSLHNGAVVHSSSPNQTNQNRVGFIVRFITPEFESTKNPVLHVRGKENITHLKISQAIPSSNVHETVKSYQK